MSKKAVNVSEFQGIRAAIISAAESTGYCRTYSRNYWKQAFCYLLPMLTFVYDANDFFLYIFYVSVIMINIKAIFVNYYNMIYLNERRYL